MKIEKRGEVTEGETPVAVPETQGKHKPVLVYLVILFAIAFALIIFSLVMHQRSNAEVLQELQGQAETLLQLQEVEGKYAEATKENEDLKAQVTDLEQSVAEGEKECTALTLLWRLEKAAAAGDEALCESLTAALQHDDLFLSLPDTAEKDDESPRAAYERIVNADAEPEAEAPAEG